jgi:linoleoyl-CoA desaturase
MNMNKAFSQILSCRIADYFAQKGITRYANGRFYFKALVLLVLWMGSYFCILCGELSKAGLLLAAVGFGLLSLLLIFNIGHDALHGSISSRKTMNVLLGYSFNLVGANAFSWYLKHTIAHHGHTNVKDADFDLDMEPFLRVSPQSPWRPWHRYQHWYAILVYMMLTLLLVFVLDFSVFFKTKRYYRKVHIPWYEWVVMLLSKTAYLLYTILVPLVVLRLSIGEIMAGFLLMHAVIGLTAALILQPSHYVEGSAFSGSADAASRWNSWAEHQLTTTIDIVPQSQLANQLLGGLNANVIHHLYPRICHVHFIPLSNIIRKTATEHGYPYRQAGFLEAIGLHFRYLRFMAKPPVKTW